MRIVCQMQARTERRIGLVHAFSLLPLMLFWFLALSSPAPGSAPVPLRAFNTSSTSLRVEWGEVPPSLRFGIILGSRVELRRLTGAVVETRSFYLSHNATEFHKLLKFEEYSVYVQSYSAAGRSPWTFVTTKTDEDGEYRHRSCDNVSIRL